MNLKLSPRSLRLVSFGLIIILVLMFSSIENFIEVKGQDLPTPSNYLSDQNLLTSKVSLISEELLKGTLSPQMQNNLNEKLSLMQNYSELIIKGEKAAASKDKALLALAPEVNDPPFQQGIFPGGDHLLIEPLFSANNYIQIKYQGNYIQIVSGKNLTTLISSLYMIVTSTDKIDSEIYNIPLPKDIYDLSIVSFEGNLITLSDQNHQIISFDLETKSVFSEN